jgi:uracil-DNA glycosylase
MREVRQHRPAQSRPSALDGELASIRAEARHCRACPLWRPATQTVFGEGPQSAQLMLVGEQPGDREDVEGRPFVGPAGMLLGAALGDAGIDRSMVYVTNAVKHFKFRARGKRRIHQRPDAGEIAACKRWLQAEVELVQPKVLVCLGGTASRAVLGPHYRVERDRGRLLAPEAAPATLITAHPSAVLRQRDSEARQRAKAALTDDLATAARGAGLV